MILKSGWFVTRDEHRADGNFPIPDLDYIRWIITDLHSGDKLIITKSRQVMVTWCVAAYLVYDVLILKNRLNIYQTKREDDATAFMERVFFLYNHLPLWIQKIRPRVTGVKENRMKLELPTQQSRVWGIPSGPDVVRMHTMSRFVSDECNFQPEAKASLRAAAPSAGDGGQLVYISSANAGGIQEGLIRGDW